MSPTRPKTVLYLTPSVRLLGARRSLAQLVTNLDRERWQPIVCGQSEGQLSELLGEFSVPFEVVRLGWWRKGKYFLWRPFVIARLATLIRRLGVDLVHCNEIYPNPYAIRACAQAERDPAERIPVVTHMRLTVSERMIRNYDLERANKIVVPSAAAGEDFNSWPDKSERVEVIHNGVDLAQFRRGRTRGEARRLLGLPRDGVMLAAIGQIGPRKGGDVILDALEAVAKVLPDVRLFFVGNSHRGQEQFAEELRRRASEPSLAGRVFFFPFTQKVLPFYEAADVNMLVSREEGFGRTIIEAAALGTPTIGARTGGIPELIDDGTTGLLVPSENPAKLADAIRRMATDEAFRSAAGEASFRQTAQHFSIRSHADQMMDLYDSVLASGAAARDAEGRARG